MDGFTCGGALCHFLTVLEAAGVLQHGRRNGLWLARLGASHCLNNTRVLVVDVLDVNHSCKKV